LKKYLCLIGERTKERTSWTSRRITKGNVMTKKDCGWRMGWDGELSENGEKLRFISWS
jgi:hypothetical protein